MTITRSDEGGIAVLTLDDGKVNALDPGVFAELDDALDDSADAPAVVLCGRDGVLSAGLNVALLQGSDSELIDLAATLTRFAMRLWTEPRPVVMAATGHAIAGGTILALACDHVVAADGDYRWGLNETAVGLVLPQWVVDLARANLRADRVERLLLPGRLVDVAEALDVGYVDDVVALADVRSRAIARAQELTKLDRAVYAANKRRLRGAAAAAALAAADRGDLALHP